MKQTENICDCPDRMKKVWRPYTYPETKKILTITVKHGGGHIMIWGCISFNEIVERVFINPKMHSVAIGHTLNFNVLRGKLFNGALKLGICD